MNITIRHFVLLQHRLDSLLIQVGEWLSVRNRDTSLVLFFDRNRWRFLVQSNTETFQLLFDDGFISQRFQYVQHDENEVACSSDCERRGRRDNQPAFFVSSTSPLTGDDLSTSSFTVLRSLDNSGKIKNLDRGAVNRQSTRNAVPHKSAASVTRIEMHALLRPT